MQFDTFVIPRILDSLHTFLANGVASAPYNGLSCGAVLLSVLTHMSRALTLVTLDAATKAELSEWTAALLRAGLPHSTNPQEGVAFSPQLCESLHSALGNLYDAGIPVSSFHVLTNRVDHSRQFHQMFLKCRGKIELEHILLEIDIKCEFTVTITL